MGNEQKIWNHLVRAGMTSAGAAGMMGNLYAESGLIPNRVEILCLQRLREIGKYYTDATYTAFVDDGTISKEEFLHPLPNRQYGYGLSQTTSPDRKSGLYNLAKSRGVSIGDLDMQLEFLVGELQTSFQSVWKVLTTTHNVKTASDTVLTKFEMPANPSQYSEQRYKYSMGYFNQFGNPKGETTMTETQAIDKVLNIALAEEGYLEKASNDMLESKTANAGANNNFTKYGRDMHQVQPSNMDFPAAWCDAFCDWCFMKAFGADLARKILCGNFDDYTVVSANYYKNAGRWSGKAARGHQIFFKNSSGICHTGLVWKVSGNTVYTIEGNSNNAVRKRQYSASDSSIAGYGVPKYYLAADTPTPTPTHDHHYTGECTVKAVQLINGDYGYAVKALQALLNLKGYKGKDGKALTVDGEFGANTEYAVAALQRDAGMTGISFGTVSTMTWECLIK